MFIAALIIIAKTWKQPKPPLTDEMVQEDIYIHTHRYTHTHTHTHTHRMEYYSAIKKNKIMPFTATQMNQEFIILGGVSQTEKDRYHMISFICGIKNDTKIIY